MVQYLFPALVRGILVALVILTPTLVLPDVSFEGRQMAMIVALIGFVIVLFEYGSSHPGLVEFRFAPPFNRIRFLCLLATVLGIALLFRGAAMPDTTSTYVLRVGIVLGQALDFPFSPVRLMVAALSDGSDPIREQLILASTGLAYAISLIMLAVLSIMIRLLDWPLGTSRFNILVNLLIFDPLAESDVAAHLERDARANITFGFFLPFLMPVMAVGVADVHNLATIETEQPLLWSVTFWAFLPASLFMRGIAFLRLAQVLRSQRVPVSLERPAS